MFSCTLYVYIYTYHYVSVYIYIIIYIIIYIYNCNYIYIYILLMTPKLITWSILYLDLYYIEREMLLQDQAVTQSSITHYHSVLCMALGTVLQVKPRLISDQDWSGKLPEASWTHSINRTSIGVCWSMPVYGSVCTDVHILAATGSVLFASVCRASSRGSVNDIISKCQKQMRAPSSLQYCECLQTFLIWYAEI